MTARILFAALIASASPLANAAGETPPANPEGPRLGLHLGLEAFSWSEKDPESSDDLVDEDGPRLTAAATLDNFLKPGEGLVYGLEGRVYAGEVSYDGETQSTVAANDGVPVNTEVQYAGGLGEARVGYRFRVDWLSYAFDVMAGLGGEYWSRDIQDTNAVNKNNQQIRVGGIEEEYTVGYAKAGFGVADLSYAEWFGRLEAGIRYPLEVDERVDELNADLSPDPGPSLYATYELSKAVGGDRRVGVTLYYDSYRLDKSPWVRANGSLVRQPGSDLVRQPESDMDVIGLRLGIFL